MTIAAIHALFLQSTGIVIDTRKITTNALFVALKGERFDANTFAAEALQLGAVYVLIDNPAYYINEQTILVADGLQTLQELAKFHRQNNHQRIDTRGAVSAIRLCGHCRQFKQPYWGAAHLVVF